MENNLGILTLKDRPGLELEPNTQDVLVYFCSIYQCWYLYMETYLLYIAHSLFHLKV